MPFLFVMQAFLFLTFTIWCFFSKLWKKPLILRIILVILPLSFGWANISILCRILSAEEIILYRSYIFFYLVMILLSLLPQWYKLIWSILKQVDIPHKSDGELLFLAFFLAALMILAMIVFFAFYFLWIDALSGFTQGLRSALMHYQPILLDWQTAFYFSFVTYFTLGYGDLIPYGGWFHFMVFLECMLSLLNTGVIVIYIYNFLLNQK